MNNLLTIDLEEWFHSNLLDTCSIDRDNKSLERVLGNTNTLLDMFERHQAKATFFVLGWVAERYPELIRRISEAGHEIASHGYAHKLVYMQERNEFEEDLQKSIDVIEKASGLRPCGYRAPSWSVTKANSWMFEVLRNNGILYDASIFPVKNFLYGIPDAPTDPFLIGENGLLEFPTSTIRILNRNVPFSGGFYFRALPYGMVKRCTNMLNTKGKAMIFYLHPRDIDADDPKVHELGVRDRFIHYYGLNRCQSKLERLLSDFSFIRVIDYFKEEDHLSKLKVYSF